MSYNTPFNPTRWFSRRLQRRAVKLLWTALVAAPLVACTATALVLNCTPTRRALVGALVDGLDMQVQAGRVRLGIDGSRAVLTDVTLYDPDAPEASLEAGRVEMLRRHRPDGRATWDIDVNRLRMDLSPSRFTTGNRSYLLLFDRLWTMHPAVNRLEVDHARLALNWDDRPTTTLDGLAGWLAFASDNRLEFSLAETDGPTRASGHVVHDGVNYSARVIVNSPSVAVAELAESTSPMLGGVFTHPLDGTIDIRADHEALRMVVRGATTVDLTNLPPRYIFGDISGPVAVRLDPLTVVDNRLVSMQAGLEHTTKTDGTASAKALADILYVLTGQRHRAAEGTVPFNRVGIRLVYGDGWLRLEGTLDDRGLAMAHRQGDTYREVLRLPGKSVSMTVVGMRLLRLELARQVAVVDQPDRVSLRRSR